MAVIQSFYLVAKKLKTASSDILRKEMQVFIKSSLLTLLVQWKSPVLFTSQGSLTSSFGMLDRSAIFEKKSYLMYKELSQCPFLHNVNQVLRNFYDNTESCGIYL